jgi:hypothetical protein
MRMPVPARADLKAAASSLAIGFARHCTWLRVTTRLMPNADERRFAAVVVAALTLANQRFTR